MAQTCNITFSGEFKQLAALRNNLRLWWDIRLSPEEIQANVRKFYNGGQEVDTKMALSEASGTTAASFIDAITSIVCDLDRHSVEDYSKRAKDFRDAILGTFFEMSSATTIWDSNEAAVNAGMTDTDIKAQQKENIEEVLYNLYGPINTGLSEYLERTFGDELRKRLIMDFDSAIVRNYTTAEVNREIVSYKEEKFQKILEFLKAQYPNDTILQGITHLYDNFGYLNSKSYNYVTTLFQKHLDEYPNLGTVLNAELDDIIGQTHAQDQLRAYKALIEQINQDSDLLSWFNKTFRNPSIKAKAGYQLFEGGRYSTYYNKIKNKLLKEKAAHPEKAWEVIDSLIKEIEHPTDDFLSVVNDYASLVYFDDLLATTLGANISYNTRDYIKNNMVTSVEDQKYQVKVNKSHQTQGWETAMDESSEAHTSSDVKQMLESIVIYKYTNPGEDTGSRMSLNLLIQSWQALTQDILEGNVLFSNNADNEEDVMNELRRLSESLGMNVFANASRILEILFEPGAVKGWHRPAIDYLVSSGKLNEGHKHVLYSFYQKVLSKANPESIISLELGRYNNTANVTAEFLPVTSNIVAVLYRNVDNRYTTCNLTPNGREFGIRPQYSWNFELFDIVEAANFSSRVRQHSGIGINEGIDFYHYKEDIGSGKVTTSVTLEKSGGLIEFEYSGREEYGLFASTDTVKLTPESAEFLDKAAKVDLLEFQRKLNGNEELTNDEQALFDVLTFVDQYVKLGVMTPVGLAALKYYKDNYSSFHKQKNVRVYSSNYLQHFVKLAMRAISVDKMAKDAIDSGKTVATHLREGKNVLYRNLYNRESKEAKSNYVQTEGKQVFLKPVSDQDRALDEFSKYIVIAKGKAAKATSRNEAGSTVPNYSIARLGSELSQRLSVQRAMPSSSAASSLLFVNREDLLDTDPVIDSEVVTILGDVKSVRDLTSGELFQHAIFDKFYRGFLDTGKICFQPTVYSDKTQFLNYFAKLSVFDDASGVSIMNFKRGDTAEVCEALYASTVFDAHEKMQRNIIDKYGKLMRSTDPQAIVDLVSVKEFLRGLTQAELKKKVDTYNAANPNDQIELELDKDYRIRKDVNGKEHCDFNEIVEYYAFLSLQTDEAKKARAEFFAKERAVFIENIKDAGIDFNVFEDAAEIDEWIKYVPEEGKEEKHHNYILSILSDTNILAISDRGKYVKEWVDKATGKLILEKDGKLNPLLEKFFYIEGLYSNNLRLSLSGSEVNHPDKDFDAPYRRIMYEDKDRHDGSVEEYQKAKRVNEGKFAAERNKLIAKANSYGLGLTPDNVEAFVAELIAARSVNDLRTSRNSAAKKLYDLSIISIINTAEGTQFKRNVIIPATLQHPVLGKVDGVADDAICAIVKDMKAPVSTLRESDKIDSQDGSAEMSCLAVILENNSLGDQRVGISRKPIWDAQTEDLTSFLAKFAAFGQTNAMMRSSAKSASGQYKMFKKMHHIRWNGEIDLTHTIHLMNGFNETDPEKIHMWFRNTLLGKQRLYYKNAYGKVTEIVGFGKRSDGTYFTKERPAYGGPETEVEVEHYFNDNGDHFTQQNAEGTLHTIDSLFELHKALGGLSCCTKEGQDSEFNIQVLANFVNNVGYKVNKVITSSYDVVQPLKKKFISYVFNTTAVKNGAKNVNPATSWTDDTPLSTFKLSNKGLGIQLNADHDVDDGELTEFSQVVAACAAYGKSFNNINEIYYGLAEAAFEASRDELMNIEKFLKGVEDKDAAKNKLYRIIGKYIVKQRSNSDLDLADRLKAEINEAFKTNKDSISNDLPIPFSDPTLYSQFISSITSVINKKSIKRKHPGSGYVMAPGYNVVQYFQLLDKGQYKPMMFDDVLRRATNDFRGKLITAIKVWNPNKENPYSVEINKRTVDIRKASVDIGMLKQIIQDNGIDLTTLVSEDANENKAIQRAIKYNLIDTQDIHNFQTALVDAYLAELQEMEATREIGWFMPTDNVRVNYSDGTSAVINLDSMDDYYKFKDGISVIERHYGVKIDTKNPKKIVISLNRIQGALPASFVLQLEDDGEYSIHFKTGLDPTLDTNFRRGLDKTSELSPEEKRRLFNAALEILPTNAVLRLNNTTEQEKRDKLGGLTKGSIAGYSSINPLSTEPESALRIGAAQLEVVGEAYDVEYFDENNNIQVAKVNKYRKLGNTPNATFQLSILSPVNLKPSLIRWQYVDENNVTRYMTIYDHPVIKQGWKGNKAKQSEIQKVLDDLANGVWSYTDAEGVHSYKLVEGSLENTEAELVMGNMYKSIFGIGDESLAEILEKGESYFVEQGKGQVVPKLPKDFYDLAFTKENGRHVLISLGAINPRYMMEAPISTDDEEVRDNGDIYYKKINVGRYVDKPASWTVEYDENHEIIGVSEGGVAVDRRNWRIVTIDGTQTVQKRVDFVKRYYIERSENVNGTLQQFKYTLYQIADVGTIVGVLDKTGEDGKQLSEKQLRNKAFAQISKILKSIYNSQRFTDCMVNTSVSRKEDDDRIYKLDNVKTREYILGCLGDEFGKLQIKDEQTNEYRDLTAKEIAALPAFEGHMVKVKKALMANDTKALDAELEEYHTKRQHYHQKWVSFLNSLHFISSRIPAQSLQSFMPMKCVGWVNGTSNVAYVSYIQTYLQGSDYDIDKAYIMGQSFTDDGVYIGWSPLFNFQSEATLQASKTLPIPRNNIVRLGDQRYDVTSLIAKVLEAKTPEQRIRAYGKLITKIDDQNGNYWYDADVLTDTKAVQSVINMVKRHEKYEVPEDLKEAANKNVASANIFNNVHDIRNRDQAYSPITMKDLQKVAASSPKGAKTKSLNMLNPLAKYVMQNQNIVGKDVIGIAANGEKVWFNLTYYYHNILRTGDTSDLFFLKMEHVYDRIQGRSKHHAIPATIRHIPDLWNADGVLDKTVLNNRLANKIKEVFYSDDEFRRVSTDDKYVDQLISQLLSAATDNAKELILSKINSGTNLAKHYIHLIVSGFSLDDIASFMTSPVVELIDRYSKSDLYSLKYGGVNYALKILEGQLPISSLVKAPKVKLTNEERNEIAAIQAEQQEARAEYEAELASQGINTGRAVEDKYPWITSTLVDENGVNVFKASGAGTLEKFIQLYIKANTSAVTAESDAALKLLAGYVLPETKNINTNKLFALVNDIIASVNAEISNYNKTHVQDKNFVPYTLADFESDLKEFRTLSEHADETSTLASVWLKLNQGIPQTDVDLIKRIKRMNATVSDREHKFGIRKPKGTNSDNFLVKLLDEEETFGETDSSTTEELLAKYNTLRTRLLGATETPEAVLEQLLEDKDLKQVASTVKTIKENNQRLEYSEILNILMDAINVGIYGNFDVYKYLADTTLTFSGQPLYTLYKDASGNIISGNTISYREIAARYYNLIKSSWNILDIMRRIPHYKVAIDLLNYSLQTRRTFAAKAKLVDKLMSLGELNYLSLSDKQYKEVLKFADRIINTGFFLSMNKTIPLTKVIEAFDGRRPKVYNERYELVDGEELRLSTLDGIDSLKHFVENEFLLYLQKMYPDNPLVKELVVMPNRGKSVLRTKLNLDDINASLNNQQTFNRYLVGIKQLAQEKFTEDFTVADILALYNLAVNGTTVSGKTLTGILRDSVTKGSALYQYYAYLGKLDNDENTDGTIKMKEYRVFPSKRDFLIALAPVVYSPRSVDFKTDPFVKLADSARGFRIMERKYDISTRSWKYSEMPVADYLGLRGDRQAIADERVFEYFTNSLTLFPEMHRRMIEQNIFMQASKDDFDGMLDRLRSYIRANRLAIVKQC